MKKNLFLSIFFLIPLFVNAQTISPSVIGNSGNYQCNVRAQLEWTLGELCVTTISSTTNTITQGFHQPDSVDLSNNPSEDVSKLTVFPNPTTSWLTINFPFKKKRLVEMQIIDVSGKIIWSKTDLVINTTTMVDLRLFASGVYIFKSIIDQKHIQSLKLIKTH